MNMVIDGRYNWKNQSERLVYIGKMDAWHRFELVDEPGKVWCEVLDEDLHMLEETPCDKSTPQGRHNSHRGLRGSAPRVSHGPGTIGSNPCSEIVLYD